MLLKILSLIDIFTAAFLYLFLNLGEFRYILIAFTFLLIAKAIFTIKNYFSYIDLFSSLVIIFAFYGIIGLLTWIVFWWLFVKGFFSLISSI